MLNRGKNNYSNNTEEGSDNNDKANPEIERQECRQVEQDASRSSQEAKLELIRKKIATVLLICY
jgi:hypothetical protein